MPAALDYTLVKKPHQRLSFTQMQIEHFVQCSDPKYFMRNFYYIQHPTRGKVLYQPYKYQEDFIDICNNNVHSIALLPRQSGKCVEKNAMIRVKNKKTGEILEIAIGEFYGHSKTQVHDVSEPVVMVSTQRNDLREKQEAHVKLSDSVERKFLDSIKLDDWLVESDTGWEEITHVNKTVEYEEWVIKTESGKELTCADTHIVFDQIGNEIFVKDTIPHVSFIRTSSGNEKVVSVSKSGNSSEMYDLTVNSDDNSYYTNDILSHNSTCVAGYLLWYAMFIPDSTVLIAAHKYQGAQEIMQRIRMGYESCPDFIRAGVTSYNKGSIEFENGSRLVAQTTTENTGRGMSISLLYLDEFAFLRNSVAKEFWASIVPTLSTGGKSIITSTPNSDEDQFWEIWRDANKTQDEFGNERNLGKNGYKAFKAEWWEHPDRDEAWAEDQKSKLGEEKFSREILCNPMIYDETLISPITLGELQPKEHLFKQGQVKWYKKPSKDHSYVISLDPSLGTGGDPAAIQVFELPSMEQAAEWQHNKTRVQGQIKVLKEILDYIYSVVGEENDIYYSIENNTIGEAGLVAIAEIGEENLRGVFLSEPKKIGNVRSFRKGFNTTQRSKIAACSKLKNWIERDKMIINSKSLISELKTFVSNGGSFAAKSGETDDLVMSTILAVRMVDFLQGYDPELDEKLKAADEFIEPMPFIFVSS